MRTNPSIRQRPGDRQARAKPFTVPHFRAWAGKLILDSGKKWVPEPFQEAFLADVFAGVPECWLIIPEGNGKTTLVAGLALYVCEFSEQPATVPVAASSREQAAILYQQAEGFVLRSPAMCELTHSDLQLRKGKQKLMVPRFNVLPGYRKIEHFRGGQIQVYAADDRTGDGVLFTLGILDELHRHRDLALYRTWAGKMGKRGGQIVAISTAGEPGGEFETTRELIRQTTPVTQRDETFIRAVSSSIVLHEWAVQEGGDIEDFALVSRANPFSRITPKVVEGKFNSPTSTRNHYSRFTCNVPTRGNNAAIQEREWAEALAAMLWPLGEPCWVGLDVGWKWDTTAIVPLLVVGPELRLLGPCDVLSPPRDGSMLDVYKVQKALLDRHAINPIHTVVADVTRAEPVASWIESEIGARVIDRGQANAFAVQDYEHFMEGLRAGHLKHCGDPDLTQHALNAIARTLPDGKSKFDRPKDSRFGEQKQRVIDALVAAAMVNSAAVAVAEAKPVFLGIA